MGGEGYVRLSGLDHAFLHFETSSTYMHIALTAIFDAGSLARADGGIDIERIRAHVASRLHLLPRYRQRLHFMPVTGDPVWVDDDAFALDFHVRHSHLPRPGTEAQLKTLIGRILERPLDRKHPLWEMWFIEGLPGDRFAMLCKVHHCMVDGIAGIELLAAQLSPVADTQIAPPHPWTPRPLPATSQMLRDELRRRTDATLGLLRALPAAASASGAGAVSRLASLAGFVGAGVRNAAATPLNGPVGPHRRVEWLDFDLAEMKDVKKRLGGTLNDVVLATVAGAVRRYLTQHGAACEGEFRALIPVSTRAVDERGNGGNRVSAWIAPLPLEDARPLERFDAICRLTSAYRENHEERGAAVLTETAEWTTALPLAAAVRLISRTRAFNVIVTNVPGPPVPFYLLDARMVAGYPHVPLFENQGLGIALLSYAGRFSYGLVGEWDLVPDIERLASAIEAAYAELREAAGITPASRPASGRKLRRVAAA
jgi:WS/DGAT/MGAT family acyltransferase